MGHLPHGIERVSPELGPGDPVHGTPQGGFHPPFQLRRIPLLLRRAGAIDNDFDGFIRRGGLPRADEVRLRDLRRKAVPKGGRLRREEVVGARLDPGERRHQR